MGIAVIFLIFSIVFMVVQISKAAEDSKKTKINKKADELKSLATYEYDGTLKLWKRSPDLASIISIADDQNIVTAYNPEKLHVGAVSVGGVVSGGAFTTGGNHYIAHSEKSGKSKLVYGGDRRIINKIWLPAELFAQAEKSSIAQYLDKNKQQISVVDDVWLSQFDLMWKQANLQAGNLGLTDAEKRGYPTYEKCLAILNWICRFRDEKNYPSQYKPTNQDVSLENIQTEDEVQGSQKEEKSSLAMDTEEGGLFNAQHELKALKKLLDEGVITLEYYDLKEKQLMEDNPQIFKDPQFIKEKQLAGEQQRSLIENELKNISYLAKLGSSSTARVLLEALYDKTKYEPLKQIILMPDDQMLSETEKLLEKL